MKTKLFGTSGIDPDIKRDLDALAELPQQDVDFLGRWLLASRKPIPFTWSEIEDLVNGTSLDPKAANRILTLLRYLLTNWRAYALTMEDVKNGLSSVGYPPPELSKIAGLLESLESIKEFVYKAAVKSSYEVTALPTVDDINVVWDIRPMFAEFAYDPEPQGSAYEELVGSTYLFLLEILASREDRKQESVTYQLSEDDFDRLLETLHKAKKQLEIIKKKAIL